MTMSDLHQCLSCSYHIAEGEDEEMVVSSKDSKPRYRHASWEGCQRAMSAPAWGKDPVTPRGRTTRPLPTLSHYDKKSDTPWERK